MSGTTIQKLVNLIDKAMADLDSKVSQEFIESTAILVHEAMSGHKRRFHTTDHIFQIIDPKGDPILVLAAIFHDIVYYNVDGGVTAQIEELINPYITIELEQVFLRRRLSTPDPVFSILLQTFGFKPGQLLTPFAGLNEFLSALVFSRMFYPILSKKNWLAVVACLEASQPFRKEDENGKTCFNHLEERLLQIDKKHRLGIGEEGAIELTLKAVRFANLDVINFAFEDTAVFLDNTWKLLPENNSTLLASKVYTMKNYRAALERMEGFFNRVDVSAIFHHYRNEPKKTEFDKLQAQAQKNVELAKYYLAGRLLSIGLLEALCMVTGGDAPVVMLMGNNSRDNYQSKTEFNDLIRQIPVPTTADINHNVLSLFEYEAPIASLLDFRKTPITAFIYRCIGQTKMCEQLIDAKKYFAGQMSPEKFLKTLDPYVVSSVAVVCAEMISTRREKFLAFAKEVTTSHSKPKTKKKVA